MASGREPRDRLPSAALHGASGRSPGSHVFVVNRLPASFDAVAGGSGRFASIHRNMLTVAGAAPGLRGVTRTGFPFHSRRRTVAST